MYVVCMRVRVYTSMCVYLCSCEFMCLVACCSDSDLIARSEHSNRRPGPSVYMYLCLDLCYQSANTSGNSKTDSWDDLEIHIGSCSEE